jgi:CubicO group peptidase (beta-lactamase class C family)
MKQNKFFILTLILLIFHFSFCGKISASAPDSLTYKIIDDYIQTQMKTYDIPGCALGIVKDDSVVFLKGYGYADDNGTKVTPQTSFLLA